MEKVCTGSDVAAPRALRRRTGHQRSRRGRLRWKILAALALVAALVYFAPAIVATTGLWRLVVARAVPSLSENLDMAGLQLGWFSRVEMRGVTLRDPTGETLAQASVVRTNKTLLDLLLTYPNVGFVVVEQPRARVVLRDGGSNVEDLVELFSPSGDAGGSIAFGLQLASGMVELDDQVAGRQWLLDGVHLDLAWPVASGQPRTGKLAATIKPIPAGGAAADALAATTGGQLAATFSWQPGATETNPGSGQAQIALGGVSTEALEGTLRRFVADIRPRGPVSLDATLAWSDEGATQQFVVTQLSTPGITITAPALLAGDQPTLVVRSGQGVVHLSGPTLAIRDLALDSNFVQLRGQGSTGSASLSPAALLGPGSDADVDLRGSINLAELAHQLPATLHLRPGTQVNSGVLDLALVSLNQPDGRRWQATLRTEQLQATAGGMPIELAEPLTVDVALRQASGGLVIERLDGRASFLHLQGQGTLADGSIAARTDLSKLVSELGRLIDFGDLRLAGSLEANLRWNRAADETWTAAADGVVRGFELSAPGMMAWKEPHLTLAAETRGVLREGELSHVSGGRLAIEAGADRLDVGLTEGVPAPSLDAVWPAKFTLRGDLATWTPRLQPFIALGNLNIAGVIDANGSGRFSTRASELDATEVQVERLALDGFGLSIREPIVKIQTAGAWDQAQRTLTLGSTTLASSSLAFRADGLRLVASSEPSVVGQIDFRGDLALLSAWLASPHVPATWQLAGALTGRVEVAYRGQSLAGKWQADVENFQYLTAAGATSGQPAWQPAWEEPRLNLAGQGTYDPASAALAIEHTSLVGSSASLRVGGSVQQLLSQANVDLTGEVAYDLAKIAELLKAHVRRDTPRDRPLPYGLETLALEGKERRSFTLQGPLLTASDGLAPAGSFRTVSAPSHGTVRVAESLTGESSLAWQRLQYVGLVAGSSELRARLAGGIVHFGPLDMPISEGRLTTAPRLHLNESSPLVVIDRGPLLQEVRISPEMCRLWLKYVAPLVADATRAEGKLSLGLEGALVPPLAPADSEIVGTLQIHAAQVGPGPLAQQYIGLARNVRTLFDANAGAAVAVDPTRGWLQMPEQNVPFEVRGGVVHHQGLMMTVRDVTITTSGSVNTQTQELNLLASIPLSESWFKREDGVFKSLKGQSIVVPIRGTLTRPQIDGKVLENLGKQLAGAAVQGVIDRQLQRGLDRLFGPPQPQAAPPSAPAPMPQP
jgi:translocation and assembly module TamB